MECFLPVEQTSNQKTVGRSHNRHAIIVFVGIFSRQVSVTAFRVYYWIYQLTFLPQCHV